MADLSTIYRLSVLLGAALALLGGTRSEETTSLGALVDCWYVEEIGGRVGSFPSGVSQKKALLLLRDGTQRTAVRDFAPPQDMEPGLLFDVVDPTLRILNPAFLRRPRATPGVAPVSCEISPFRPQPAFVDWALSLTPEQRSPPDLGGAWYATNLQDPRHAFSIASIHKEVPGAAFDEGAQAKSTLVALNVFTRTPVLGARLSSAVLLDCGFTVAARQERFSVEWRYQFQGAGHVVYAYDGVSDRVGLARDGAELFFQEIHESGNASLLLHHVAVEDEGTYICSVYTPYLHAQQAVELRISEPPQVSLGPEPLYVLPGQEQVLECQASAYYPLDVSIEWLRRNGTGGPAEYVTTSSWQSSHRSNSDGTFTLSSYIRVRGSVGDHGALYSCYVSHAALETGGGVKRSLRLSVAGESGPSMDDAIGLFITAFLLFGVLKFISMKVSPWLSGDPQDGKEKAE